MISIDLLKNHPENIARCAEIWHEVLGKIWMPSIGIEEIGSMYYAELSENMPLTFIALCGEILVGSGTLQLNDGIRPDLEPWIGDLVVDPKYQKQGIGKLLIEAMKTKAQELGFNKLYLFTFEPAISNYYNRLGWQVIGTDEFKGHQVTVMEIEL